jgi:peroxiredoxin (alkyl hydroperoxide reductase subunit C)
MQKRQSRLLAAALLLTSTLGVSASGFSQATTAASTIPKVGDMAPDFTLKYFDGTQRKDVKLSDYRGKKNVVLAFFVFAFTGG